MSDKTLEFFFDFGSPTTSLAHTQLPRLARESGARLVYRPMLLGGNYLDYFVLDRDPAHGQHRGIFWVEVGVCLTVSSVMLKIFYMFAGRRRREDDE